jgi:hypothetical protein
MAKALTDHPDWCLWLNENMRRGCDHTALVETLLKNGFDQTSIRIVGSDQLRASMISFPDQRKNYPADENKDTSPGYVDPSYRTSQTCDLSLLDNDFVKGVDDKICGAMGIPAQFSEGTQLQRYDVGQQFRQHTDYFAPATDEYAAFCAEKGNRTWTFMIYLNDVQQGGGTHFFAINQTILPRRGTAIAWNNRYPDGHVNPDTLHAGLPVEEGCKMIITKWFRER